MPKRTRYLLIVMLVCLAVLAGRLFFFANTLRETEHQPPRTIVDFPSQEQVNWLNSAPLTLPQLQGKAVLLFIWTFD